MSEGTSIHDDPKLTWRKPSEKKSVDTFARTGVPCYSMRRKLTLNVDEELIEQMKIRCILEKCDLSTVTERLYGGYLSNPPENPLKRPYEKSRRKVKE